MHHSLRQPVLRSVLAVSSAVVLAACSSDTRAILAPSNALLAIEPGAQFVVINESVEVMIRATKSDGSPVLDGTEIDLSASSGQFESSSVRTTGGTATAVYTAGGEAQPAQLFAVSDSVQAEVALATTSAPVSTVIVTVSSTLIPPGGGEVEVTAIAVGPAGQPVAGAPVTLAATVGSFVGTGGGPHFTNQQGQVTLRLSASEATEVRARVHTVESSPLALKVGRLLDPWDDPDLPFRLRDVVWLHADATEWEESSEISDVTFVGSGRDVTQICFPHSKAGRWPRSGVGEGNVWIFAEIDGTWYAATWDYIRVGQVCKGANGFTWGDRRHGVGAHTQRPPLEGWTPRSGETVGLMVSGFARTTERTTLERSNIFLTEWP
jgi:hypothetical protein